MTRPFDDIRALFDQFVPDDAHQAAVGRLRLSGLAELGPIAAWITAWRGQPRLVRPILSLYAGAHAGGDIGPTRSRLEAIASGAAAVSQGVQHLGAGLDVFDLALERPVGDQALGPAMSERECAATMAFGMEALAKQPDLLVLIGLGPGADAAAETLAAALGGELAASGAVVRAAAEAGSDPLQLMRQLGGRETAALAGAILAARTQGVPVLLDGAPALAAAAVLNAISPQAIAHCRLGHVPATPAGRALARLVGQAPLVPLQLSLDDGTASVAALSIVKLAVAIADGTPG